VQAQAGDLAYRCVKRATALALAGEISAIATAPLNKEALHLAGHMYPGHTELLATPDGKPRLCDGAVYRQAEGHSCFDAYCAA
jgi:4-hydroxy-L-threonine phosphate dehydrogenase PdxA